MKLGNADSFADNLPVNPMQTPATESKAAETPARLPECLMAVLLVAMTILAYQPVWHARFIWDDNAHITRRELQSFHGLTRIWTEFGATAQYYPLAHSAFWAEHKLWGEAPAPYHWVNILLHSLSAVLVAAILRRLQVPGAWLAAGLFALHPVQVESVAWISELKNTLSGVFYLGAMLAYFKFQTSNFKPCYRLSLVLFILGLTTKTVVASLPAALLLILWWRRGKLSWKGDVLPLTPFFIAGAGAGLLTAWVERHFTGAEGAGFQFSLVQRCLIAGRAIWFYLGKLCWPVDLSFSYTRWDIAPTAWWQYLFPAAVAILLAVLIWRGWRGPLAAFLFFAGTLFPALGFLNVYPFRYSFVADHFQYLACLGPFVLAAAAFDKLLGRAKPVAFASLLLVLAALTWRQAGHYANGETLWQATLRTNPQSWMARNNYGLVLLSKGQTNDAISQYRQVIILKPDFADAHINLGAILNDQGQVDEAITHFQQALRSNPDNPAAHHGLACSLALKGQTNDAIFQYNEALRLNPITYPFALLIVFVISYVAYRTVEMGSIALGRWLRTCVGMVPKSARPVSQ